MCVVISIVYHTDNKQRANFHHPSVNEAKYQQRVYYVHVKVFNMLPSYIKTEFDNLKNLKRFYENFYMKTPFIIWINTLNFKKVKIGQIYESFGTNICFPYVPICLIYLFVYIFIILSNLDCVETSNIVLGHMIVVHFCVGFTS